MSNYIYNVSKNFNDFSVYDFDELFQIFKNHKVLSLNFLNNEDYSYFIVQVSSRNLGKWGGYKDLRLIKTSGYVTSKVSRGTQRNFVNFDDGNGSMEVIYEEPSIFVNTKTRTSAYYKAFDNIFTKSSEL